MSMTNLGSTSINITAIRTNGLPITQQFSLSEWGEGRGMCIIDLVCAVTHWTTAPTYGGIVRLFVNIDNSDEEGTETVEFNDVDSLRLYIEEYDESGLVSQWSVEK
jgi:hypothetical protein